MERQKQAEVLHCPSGNHRPHRPRWSTTEDEVGDTGGGFLEGDAGFPAGHVALEGHKVSAGEI